MQQLSEEAKAIHEMISSLAGGEVITYIRPISNELYDSGYAVCAADGSPLAVFSTYDEAYYTARQYQLEPQAVH